MRATRVLPVLAALSACSDAVGPFTGDGVDALDTWAGALVAEWEVGALAAAVVIDGRLVYARGVGWVDAARTDSVRPTSLFRVASVSKPITGIAVLRAIELGHLGLDDQAFGLLSDLLPTDGSADPRLGDVTVAHLLHHGSGFVLYGETDPLVRTKEVSAAMGTGDPPPSDAIVGYMARQPLGFTPGSGFQYTNVGYVTLGRVLERATGVPYETWIRDHVFAPVGVTRARIGGPRRSDRLPGEVEYDARGAEWLSIFPGEEAADAAYGGLHLRGFDASSGWVLSAVDLVRLAAAVDGHPGVPDLLGDASQAVMRTDGTPPGGASYGAGWFLSQADGVTWWVHSGGMPGTASYLAGNGTGTAVALVVNRVGGDDFYDDLIQGFFAALERVDAWPDGDLFARYF